MEFFMMYVDECDVIALCTMLERVGLHARGAGRPAIEFLASSLRRQLLMTPEQRAEGERLLAMLLEDWRPTRMSA
jgi:hypothetical protein